MSHDPLDPDADCFKPPPVPTEVHCLHCHLEYDSYLMEYRIEVDREGHKRGFWCCPTPGCGGKGFGFDIFPTDPDYRGPDGLPMWESDGDENEDWEGEATDPDFDPKFDVEFDPAGEPGNGSSFDAAKEMEEILKEVDDSLPTAEEERQEEDADDEEDMRPF